MPRVTVPQDARLDGAAACDFLHGVPKAPLGAAGIMHPERQRPHEGETAGPVQGGIMGHRLCALLSSHARACDVFTCRR